MFSTTMVWSTKQKVSSNSSPSQWVTVTRQFTLATSPDWATAEDIPAKKRTHPTNEAASAANDLLIFFPLRFMASPLLCRGTI
jgi:hypothetical protein